MGFSFRFSLHVFVAIATWQLAAGVTNLLVNPSFEEDLAGNWRANGFNMVRYTGDVVDGNYSVKCSGRCVLGSLHHSLIVVLWEGSTPGLVSRRLLYFVTRMKNVSQRNDQRKAGRLDGRPAGLPFVRM